MTVSTQIRSPESLATMVAGTEPRKIDAGVALLRQGERSDEAFVLTEGTVKVVAETAYGAVPLATIRAPGLVGEIGALSGVPRTASIIAITPLTVHVVTRRHLIEAGRSEPKFLVSLIAQLGSQLEGMNRTLSLYSKALEALQLREFDPRILGELANPCPELLEFSMTFRNFAQEIIAKRQRHDEVASAALIQRSYLPRHSALAACEDRLELEADMRAARNVGGDFYDYFLLDETHLAFAIGDVCGKGIPASLFMAVVMTVLRMCGREERSAADAIRRTNEILSRDNATSMFATAFYGVLDLEDGTLEYCNCGHNAPLILRADGTLDSLPATGLPLALYPEREAAARTVSLAPDDLLVLYTDGVTEALNPQQEEYSEERLERLVARAGKLSAREIVAQVFESVDCFAAGAEQADDITCVVLRRIPAPQRP